MADHWPDKPPEWFDRGNCRNADMYPDGLKKQQAAVTRYCRTCPVQPECLRVAIRTGEVHGVWGGTTEEQRRPLLRGHVNHGRLVRD